MKKVICRHVDDTPDAEVAIDLLEFRPSVYGVVIKNNKVLLSAQWDGYDIPGGSVDLGETNDEALVREVQEETGLVVKRNQVLACESDFFIHPHSKKPLHTILAFYLCDYVSGDINTDGFSEHEKAYAKPAEWIDINKTHELKFYNPVDSVAIIQKAYELSQVS